MRTFRLAMVQMNPTVGIWTAMSGVSRDGSVRPGRRSRILVVFPELAVTGYPPEDLLLKSTFIEDNGRALRNIIRDCRDLATVIGYVAEGGISSPRPDRPMVVPAGRHELYNAAAVIADGRLIATCCKRYLPNYGVFDESRYFHPGRQTQTIVVNGTILGVNICEDIWYPEGPTRAQAAAGAEVIVNINASPFHVGKSRFREQMLATRARDNGVIVTYTNMVGGQDELVFDGNSLVLDQTGEVILRGKACEEDLLVVDLNVAAVARTRTAQARKKWLVGRMASGVSRVLVSDSYKPKPRGRLVLGGAAALDPLDEVYRVLVLGVRDYVRKNGFERAVIGLSGGIDSSLTTVIAADALGATNVLVVFMPSPYTSRESHEDVAELVRGLGLKLRTIPITAALKTYQRALASSFRGRSADTTEENLQARIRGNILMAFSNKFGHLVLTTGNKSELSVGYATLYGDMAGGFAVIKDLPKTMVYDLARLRNRPGERPVIPKRVFDRPPTAELRPNQKDEDSLPPYAVLDPILKAYVEEEQAPEEIVDMGFDRETVERVIAMVDRSEYKRRQAPIGIKITHRAFGKDRRMPITNGYRSL